MKTYSLYELNEFLRRIVALNFSETIWITAEIGQSKRSRGIYYLHLLEKEGDTVIAEMQAVIWNSQLSLIRRQLAEVHNVPTADFDMESVIGEGLEVRLRGRVDFHERFGLKIIVEEIDSTYTLGKLALQRQQLIANLQKEGLFEKNSKLMLPIVMQRIAVITSKTAAGWADFQEHIKNNHYQYTFDIHIFESAMQGNAAAEEVGKALLKIEKIKNNFDCVVIIRGGGAKLDLIAFDDAKLARTVANHTLPILVGIGHEIDSTIIDMVAHTSLKTPTAVADFLVNYNANFEALVLEASRSMRFLSQNTLYTEGGVLLQAENIVKQQTDFLLKKEVQKLDFWQQMIPQNVQNMLEKAVMRLDNIEKNIELMSIDATLKRGFSITRRPDGSLLDSVTKAKKGEMIETEIADGKIMSHID